MNQLIIYLAPSIVFFAVILGLLGPSRKSGVSGIAGISLFGWGLAGLATIGLLFNLSSVYKNQQELEDTRAENVRIANVAKREIANGHEHIKKVLRFAALMPYITSEQGNSYEKDTPYSKDQKGNWVIDLKSEKTLNVLANLYLDPESRINGLYIPSVVPFGTDIRPTLIILSEETIKAIQMIETAVKKYAGSAISADLIEISIVLVSDPFIEHLTKLRERWAERSQAEDSIDPRSQIFGFLNSGKLGGGKEGLLTTPRFYG